MTVIKLKDSEAERLAALLVLVARPRTPDEADQIAYWVNRLQSRQK